MLRLIGLFGVFVGVLVGCGDHPGPQRDPVADRTAIEAALRQWPYDFNDHNTPAVCGLFARDVVLAYPGGPDRGYQAFCDRMQALFNDPDKKYSYAEPQIREVSVDGDLATVALMWTLTVKDTSGKVLDTMTEDGLDVFQRQPDGSWKIHISHAFTV